MADAPANFVKFRNKMPRRVLMIRWRDGEPPRTPVAKICAETGRVFSSGPVDAAFMVEKCANIITPICGRP